METREPVADMEQTDTEVRMSEQNILKHKIA